MFYGLALFYFYFITLNTRFFCATAADVGAETLWFEILRQNRPMISLAAGMGAEGFPIEGDRSVVEYRLAVPPPSATAMPAGALYELLRHAPRTDGTDT